MKKILLIASAVVLLSSCASFKAASVPNTNVSTPTISTATAATLEVSPTKVSYTYIPTNAESRNLSLETLKENAVFEVLSRNDNADALVEVSYYITAKKRFMGFGTRVRYIIVSGYPVKYKDFRQPTEVDLRNIETLSRSQMLSRSTVKEVSVDTPHR